MRSHLVFSAAERTPNRYLLCRMISRSARILLSRNRSFPHSINSCLELAGGSVTQPAGKAAVTRPVANLRMLEAL
jgi:hypothetical protein